MWGDAWCLKALAVAYTCNLIVITRQQVHHYHWAEQYVPRRQRGRQGQPVHGAYVHFPNNYGGKRYDLSAAAFQGKTMFLLYNGVDHYFPAYRKASVIDDMPASWSALPPEELVLLNTESEQATMLPSAAQMSPENAVHGQNAGNGKVS